MAGDRRGIAELQRLLAGELVTKGDWGTLARHLRFGQGVDLHDIAEVDWPSVRSDIEAALYSELEPLPIEIDDLATLAASRPQGTVTTALNWSALDGDGFERLIFNLLTDAPGYENTRRPMGTNAPDRGRDISTERIVTDTIAGTKRLSDSPVQALGKQVGQPAGSHRDAQFGLLVGATVRSTSCLSRPAETSQPTLSNSSSDTVTNVNTPQSRCSGGRP